MHPTRKNKPYTCFSDKALVKIAKKLMKKRKIKLIYIMLKIQKNYIMKLKKNYYILVKQNGAGLNKILFII